MCSLCDDGRDGMTCTERTESDEAERNVNEDGNDVKGRHCLLDKGDKI